MALSKIHCFGFALVILTLYCSATCKTINETSALYSYLRTNYRAQVRPALHQDDPVEIYAEFSLSSLQDFDDLTGLLKLTSSLSLEWIDPRLTWNPEDYGNITNIVMFKENVWSPDFITMNAPDHDYVPGQNANRVRVFKDGWVRLQSFDFLEVMCAVDINDYPYDTQRCSIVILPWGYWPDEVVFRINNDTSFNSHVPPWSVDSSAWSVSRPHVSITSKSSFSGLRVTLTFTRRYAYVIANLIIPVFILSFLNTWVFLLPPESGERISFSITVFLSFAVYMTILSDNMPKGSEPLAKLNYQMVITMLYSVSILFCTVVSLRMYNNMDKKGVPRYLKMIIRATRCKKLCSGGTNAVGDEGDRKASYDSTMYRGQGETINAQFPHINNQRRASLVRQPTKQKLPVLSEDGVNDKKTTATEEEVTWLDVGLIFDMSMFVLHTIWWVMLILLQTIMSGTYNYD